jgi:hypothetical protein
VAQSGSTNRKGVGKPSDLFSYGLLVSRLLWLEGLFLVFFLVSLRDNG